MINPSDQKSFPLFGDGAGAVLLAPGTPEQGLVAYQLGSDGSGGDLLSRPACGSRIPPSTVPSASRAGKPGGDWDITKLRDGAAGVPLSIQLRTESIALW